MKPFTPLLLVCSYGRAEHTDADTPQAPNTSGHMLWNERHQPKPSTHHIARSDTDTIYTLLRTPGGSNDFTNAHT